MARRSLTVPIHLQTRPASPALSTGSSRASSRSRYQESASTEGIASDRATSAFVRDVLYAGHNEPGSKGVDEDLPISDLLPPLTSSNAVDLQLYALIAIIVHDLVYSWYSKITPDHVFVDEVLHIIAHCTRALEERARKSDLESLVLDDIPALVDTHVDAYRTATKASSDVSAADAENIYHALRPHPALDRVSGEVGDYTGHGDQDVFRSYCHILSQGLLAILLPTEDLQNPALRALVSEVVADLIIGNFIGIRISEPSFFYDSIRKAAEIIQPRLKHEAWAFDEEEASKNRLSRFGLLSKKRNLGGAILRRRTMSEWVLLAMDYAWLVMVGARILFSLIASSALLPHRSPAPLISSMSSPNSPTMPTSASSKAVPKPILEYKVWPASARLLCLSERLPWITGLVALVDQRLFRAPRGWGGYDTRLDRLLAHHLLTHIFPLSQHLPTVLLNLRLSLFPANTLLPPTLSTPPAQTRPSAPPSPTTTSSTTLKSKRAAAFALLNCIPKPAAHLFFAPHNPTTNPTPASTSAPRTAPPSNARPRKRASTFTRREAAAEARDAVVRAETELMVRDVEETVLDAFGNAYMNRHVVLAVLERVLVAVVPELGRGGGEGRRSIDELLGERGVVGDGGGSNSGSGSGE